MSRKLSTAATLLGLMGREARRFRPAEAAGVVEPLLDSGALRLDSPVIGLHGQRTVFLADWLDRVRCGEAMLGDADFACLDKWSGGGWWFLPAGHGRTLLGGWVHDLQRSNPGTRPGFQSRQDEWCRIFRLAPLDALTEVRRGGKRDDGRLLGEVLWCEDREHGQLLPSDILLERGLSAAARDGAWPVAMAFTEPHQWTAFLAAGGNPDTRVPARKSTAHPQRTSLWEYLLLKKGLDSELGKAVGAWAEASVQRRGRLHEHRTEQLFEGVLNTTQGGIGGRVRAAAALPGWADLRGLDGRNLLMALLEDPDRAYSMSCHAFARLAAQVRGKPLLTAVDHRGEGLWSRALLADTKDSGIVVSALEGAGLVAGPDTRGRGLLVQALLGGYRADGGRHWLGRRSLHDAGSAFYACAALGRADTWLAASEGDKARALARLWKTPALLALPGLFGVANRLAVARAAVDAAWGEAFLAAAVCEQHSRQAGLAVADWAMRQGAGLAPEHVLVVERGMGVRPSSEQTALLDRLRLASGASTRRRRLV